MIERIVLFMPPLDRYGVLHHFTKELYAAFQRAGVEAHLLTADYNNPKPFMDKLFEINPSCTLSFNGLLPDNQGRFFADMIKIPHIAYLVDNPNHFLDLVKSNYTIIGCPDRYGCDFFRGLNHQNVAFLPVAADKVTPPSTLEKRPIDVLMVASCIDYQSKQASWGERYGPVVQKIMEKTIDITLADNHTPYVQAFANAVDLELQGLGSVDLKSLNYPSILKELDLYLRGRARVELVKAIKNAKVHVYQGLDEKDSWSRYLAGQTNVEIHQSVDFGKILDVMRQSKIILNSSPHFKNGTSERVFYGASLGGLVVTGENNYLKERFKDGENICFYSYNQVSKVNDRIDYYLANEKERSEVAARGQAVVAAHHTWDQRAQLIIKEVAPLLMVNA